MNYHAEKLPSAIERYQNEAKRVSTVIDTHLKDQKTKYLVGDKLTYADLAFIPWFKLTFTWMLADWKYKEELPVFAAWADGLIARESVTKVSAAPEFQRH
jgi:glutathione S-transferase